MTDTKIGPLSYRNLCIKANLARDTITKWKNEGAEVLQKSPVDYEAFDAWRKEHKPESYQWSVDRKRNNAPAKMDLKQKKLELETKNLAIKHERELIELRKAQEKVIEVEDIVASMRGFHETIRATLEFHMLDQLPLRIEGKSAAECRPIFEEVFDQIIARIRAYEERAGKITK